MGLVAPLVAALVYRTYALSLSPSWLEMTRQLGTPYVLAEIGVIIHARRQGFDVSHVLRRLDPAMRYVLILFLSTFWISSVFVSAMPSFSTALCLIMVVHLYAAAALFHLADGTQFTARRFAPGFAAGLVALTAIVVFHLSLLPRDVAPSSWLYGAPIPGFVSIRLFGAWAGAVLALLLGIAWTADRGGETPRWIYPAIALATAVAMWTGTRAALWGIVVALAVAAAMTRGGAAPGFWRKVLTAMALGALVAILTPLPNGAGSLLFRANSMDSADSFASGRLQLWTKSLAVAIDRPWLGHGMGSSWWLVSINGFYHVQPHNALVQFLLNWGLIPTIAALILLGKAVWRVHRLARGRPERLALLMMLDFLLSVSLLDGMLHFAQFVMLIAVLIGACLAPAGRDAAREA